MIFLFTGFTALVDNPDVLNVAKEGQTSGAMRGHVARSSSYFLYGSQS